jgi:hypothetical protein
MAMAAFQPSSINPAWLEMVEGPNELLRRRVTFTGPGGKLQQEKIIAWTGPGRGYSVKLFGCGSVVQGVMAKSMTFFTGQENQSLQTQLSTASLRSLKRSTSVAGFEGD